MADINMADFMENLLRNLLCLLEAEESDDERACSTRAHTPPDPDHPASSPQTSALNPNADCKVLSLPAEIRNTIWELTPTQKDVMLPSRIPAIL